MMNNCQLDDAEYTAFTAVMQYKAHYKVKVNLLCVTATNIITKFTSISANADEPRDSA